MEQGFSHGRTDLTVSVRLLVKYQQPGGALFLPGERLMTSPQAAHDLCADGTAVYDAATPDKSLDAAPRDTMQKRPFQKKGMA